MCVCMRAPFNCTLKKIFFHDGYTFVCVYVCEGGGGVNSMFIVLTGALVLISLLLYGCSYQMCCLLLSCGTTLKFL